MSLPVTRSTRSLATVAALLLLTALGGIILRSSAADAAIEGAATELVVTTSDFAFAAPRSVPAGLTRIVLHNGGAELHHVQLVRLDPGHSYAEYMERLAAGDLTPAWATFVGGPDTPGPGGRAEATLLLTEGEYVMICVISGEDKVPHVAKGMSFPLRVVAPVTPVADAEMVLDEYSFTISPEIRFGRRTLRVENRGKQAHHVAIFKLADGRTAEEALRWASSPVGPAPGVSVGGTTAIAPGLVNYVTAEFTPGEYVLTCYVPDATDGRSHVAHGMVRTITVR